MPHPIGRNFPGLLSASLVGTALIAVSQANASGYNIGTQSISAQSTANANGAEVADASVIYANPAGMLQLEGTNFSGVLNLVMPDIEFSQDGDAFANLNGTFIPMTVATSGGEAFEDTVIPHFYLSHRVNQDLAVGLGIFVPFGAAADFDDDFAGRYYTRKTELKTININPSVAFRINEKMTFGFGINAQYLEGEIARKVYGPSIVGGVATRLATAGAITPAQAQAITAGAVGADALNNMDVEFAVEDADSWGLGFNLGVMYEVSEATRVGVAYRSRVRQDVEGDASLTDLDTVIAYMNNAGIPGAATDAISREADGQVSLDTPESASLSIFHQINPEWAVMADLTWTAHDRLEQIAVRAQPVTTTFLQTDWDNTLKLSVGASWQATRQFQFRFGYMYDESPVTSAQKTLTTFPDNDRQWFSFGGIYDLTESSQISFAYSYIKIKDRRINRSYDSLERDNAPDNDRPPAGTPVLGSSSGLVNGTFESSAQIIGVQWNQSF